VSVLFVLVASAHAQSYGPPTYAVGDTWKRNVAGQMMDVKVVKVEDGGTWFTGARTDCPTCLSFQDKNLTLLQLTTADGKEVDVTQMNFVPIGPQWKLFDFPLELNKAWRIVSQAFSRGTSYNYEVDIKVANYSDVKTPAGTFKAFRVRQDWVYRDRSGGTWD